MRCITLLVVFCSLASVPALTVHLQQDDSSDVTGHAEQTFSVMKQGVNFEHMLSTHSLQPAQLHWLNSFFYEKSASKLRFLALSMMCALFVMAMFLAPWKCWGSSLGDDLLAAAEPHPDVAGALEAGEGTWAHAYQNAKGNQKDALELLFRCGIVSVHEHAHSHASQDHIEECMGIAQQMLRQKPLEEWVFWRQQALESFEDSITAIFSTRPPSPIFPNGYGNEEPQCFSYAKAYPEAPLTPPLQGVLKDLLILKGAFPSPAMSTRSNASTVAAKSTRSPAMSTRSNVSTVPVSPATPGRFPPRGMPAVPFDCSGMNITFDKPVVMSHTVPCSPTFSVTDPYQTVPHLSLSAVPPPTLPCLSAGSLDDRRFYRPVA